MKTAELESLVRNDIVVATDGTHHRLLSFVFAVEDLDGVGPRPLGHAYLIEMESELALPYFKTAAEVLQEYNLLPKPVEKPLPSKSASRPATSMLAFERAASPARLKVAARAIQRIEPLVNAEGIYEPSTRHALFVKRSREPNGGTPKTMLKDFRRYWQGGQTMDALLGLYDNSGRSGSGTGKRGSQKEDGTATYQLTEKDYENLRDVIEKYYFDLKKHRTLTATHFHLRETFYTYLDGNRQSHLKPQSECPSYRQLQYFLKEHYPEEVIKTRRKGKKRFALEDRSTEGSIQLECHGSGHIYEFDASIADTLLASLKNRADIVGKPTIYLIIDRHSRLIVGYYLGFENASYSPAMQAILSIAEDKEILCARVGVPYDPNDWPADGIGPEMFLTDQGELVHKEARRVARTMRATICNVPGMRPDWKPLVECGFSMIHRIIAPDTPAFSPDAEAKKRRAVNHDKDVALNIEEFEKLIVMAIITHNKTMQDGYPLSLQQVQDGVRPIPRDLWIHGVKRRMGALDRLNYEKLRDELMPRGKAKITQNGIEFNKLLYSCPEANKRGWLVQGRRKRKDIDIAFDYRRVDELVVYAPEGSGESFVASLTKDSGKFKGMSFAEVARHFWSVRQLTAGAADIRAQQLHTYRQQTKPIIDNAVREAKEASKGVSRSSRHADTKPARQEDLNTERQRIAGIVHPSLSGRASPTPAPSRKGASGGGDRASDAGSSQPNRRTAPHVQILEGDAYTKGADNSSTETMRTSVSGTGALTRDERLAAVRKAMML